MGTPRYPSLYQINTRVRLTELSRSLGWPATLDDIPDADLDGVAKMGFDWVWLLSVWSTGLAGQRVSRANAAWPREFEDTLGELYDDDIGGSGFAITGYSVDPRLGGDAALARLRERLRARDLRLMLDFVPNHTALDHPWTEQHVEYYVAGSEHDLARLGPRMDDASVCPALGPRSDIPVGRGDGKSLSDCREACACFVSSRPPLWCWSSVWRCRQARRWLKTRRRRRLCPPRWKRSSFR